MKTIRKVIHRILWKVTGKTKRLRVIEGKLKSHTDLTPEEIALLSKAQELSLTR